MVRVELDEHINELGGGAERNDFHTALGNLRRGPLDDVPASPDAELFCDAARRRRFKPGATYTVDALAALCSALLGERRGSRIFRGVVSDCAGLAPGASICGGHTADSFADNQASSASERISREK